MTYTLIDVTHVTPTHARAVATILGGTYDERRREVALDAPLSASLIRAALGHLWPGVACKRARGERERSEGVEVAA